MKKKTKILLIFLILLLSPLVIIPLLFISSALFRVIFFPEGYMYGESLSRKKAVELIDRGTSILPKGIENVTFSVVRYYPRGCLSFTGKVDFDDFQKWCKNKGYKIEKTLGIVGVPELIIIHLKLKPTELEGYYHLGREYIYYDTNSHCCYVNLFNVGPPHSLSDFEEFKIVFFSYFTDYWRDLTIKK